jgi:hypothetical protein
MQSLRVEPRGQERWRGKAPWRGGYVGATLAWAAAASGAGGTPEQPTTRSRFKCESHAQTRRKPQPPTDTHPTQLTSHPRQIPSSQTATRLSAQPKRWSAPG